MLEKIFYKLRSGWKRKSASAAFLGIFFGVSCGPLDNDSLDAVVAGTESQFGFKEYENSIGYWIPENYNYSEVGEEFASAALELGLDAFFEFGLGVSTAWSNPITALLNQTENVGQSANLEYFVKTENSKWEKYAEICSDEKFMAALAYNPGDTTMHVNGLNLEVYEISFLENYFLKTKEILKPGEELGTPPNFFVLKEPLSFEEFSSEADWFGDNLFFIGFENSGTKVNMRNCDNIEIPPFSEPPNQGLEDFFQEQEPNDSIETANLLPFERYITITGKLNPSEDSIDYYSFDANADDEITVSLNGGITIISPLVLESCTDDMSFYECICDEMYECSRTFVVPESDRYYFLINPNSGIYQYGDQVDYLINLEKIISRLRR